MAATRNLDFGNRLEIEEKLALHASRGYWMVAGILIESATKVSRICQTIVNTFETNREEKCSKGSCCNADSAMVESVCVLGPHGAGENTWIS
jgi:hypothetical protein